ncbi:hypothetical protein [Actinocorallia longicatena]|uniref:Uncharacterized protein n=1 Tax=Actinocorallia longicatena TaxID=111803 RepID=A0ABP6Q6H6_9ACTN
MGDAADVERFEREQADALAGLERVKAAVAARVLRVHRDAEERVRTGTLTLEEAAAEIEAVEAEAALEVSKAAELAGARLTDLSDDVVYPGRNQAGPRWNRWPR